METLGIDAWLEPLAGEAAGPDMEYDAAFLTLDQAAAGKPETQFAPAEPPQWPMVRELAEELFASTRDLRVAMPWSRAVLNIEGVEALPATLKLLAGLIDRFWEELHPRNDPDDGDAFARLSVLGGLDKLDSFLGDVRQNILIKDRRLGGLTIREIEIALERLGPRADEVARTQGQIQGMLEELPDLTGRLRNCHAESLAALKTLQTVMNDRFGIENAVDVKSLRGMLEALKLVLPEEATAGDAADGAGEEGGGDDGAQASNAPRRKGGGMGSIDSRQDAVKAINLVCAYLERHEPTNPAQMLLRRAERLIDKNFMQLVRDLAPDAMSEVARIMGVNPEDFRDDSD
jgi:type VI secretion system protein ImpA